MGFFMGRNIMLDVDRRRQLTKMRIKYLEAALSQDKQFFDTEVRTSGVVYAIDGDAVMVQDAISEKLGNFIHYMATFVSGFVVGFTAVFQLALVTLAVVPLIAVIGGIHATTLPKLSSKSQGGLSQAGNIAELVEETNKLLSQRSANSWFRKLLQFVKPFKKIVGQTESA